MVRNAIATVTAGVVALGWGGARAAPVELGREVPAAAHVYVPEAAPCGPESNDRGDLAIAEATVTAPDAAGLARLSISIRTAVGAGEFVPPTRGAILRGADPWLTFDILGITSINNKCPDVRGAGCDKKCRTTGCNGGNGVCSCEPGASGSEVRCKCVSIYGRGFGVPARSGETLRVVLDDLDEADEDDECNNAVEVVVP